MFKMMINKNLYVVECVAKTLVLEPKEYNNYKRDLKNNNVNVEYRPRKIRIIKIKNMEVLI